MSREMIVTDLTRMRAPRVCVAGFFSENGMPVRPVVPLGKGDAITEEFLWKDESLVVQPFAEVRLAFGAPVSDPPHTEDWEIDPQTRPELVRVLSPTERWCLLRDHLDPSVEAIFGAPVQDNRYVCKGEGQRSLGTVLAREVYQVAYRRREYEDGTVKWDYRIWFTDESGADFGPAITDLTFRSGCDHLRDEKGWKPNRVSDWLTRYLSSSERAVYLRIGLARGWEKYPDRCYLQVTGIYSFPDYLGGKTLCDFV
jgi:hypothetical protein